MYTAINQSLIYFQKCHATLHYIALHKKTESVEGKLGFPNEQENSHHCLGYERSEFSWNNSIKSLDQILQFINKIVNL